MLAQEYPIKIENSKELFEEATKYLPGGVSSDVWLVRPPIFFQKGEGSKIYDVDGNCFTDFFLGCGPLILGHAHPKLVRHVKEQLEQGSTFHGGTELLVGVAKKIVKLVPSVEKLRFSCSGTEANLHAIRVARAYTGRDKILKFEGQYHGWHDYVSISSHPPLVTVGLEIAPHRIPDSAGILRTIMDSVIIAPWNEPEILERIIRQHKNDLAAVLTAPIPYSMGVVPPKEEYLKTMRELTEENDILLIFDEVFNGFRESLGGGQEKYGVTPDLCTMAKAMSGGFPISAIGGKAEVMEIIGQNKVEHMGTLNANPLCLIACKTTLQELEEGGLKYIHGVGRRMLDGISSLIEDIGIDAIVQGSPAAFTIFFTKQEKIENYREFLQVDKSKLQMFVKDLLKERIFIVPSTSHKFFISTAHTHDDIKNALEVAEKSLKIIKHIG